MGKGCRITPCRRTKRISAKAESIFLLIRPINGTAMNFISDI
jgi:hypothetical protein